MATAATEKTRLIYSNSRGFAEKIRLMLCVLEIPFENVTIRKRSEFLKLLEDGHLLFKQTPLLEYNGLKLVQSHATMRYLAATHNMYGANPLEQLRINMFYDAIQDFVNPFVFFQFSCTAEESLKQGKKAMDRFCPVIEKELAENKTGFLVGNSMTLADVALIHVMLEVEEHYGPDSLKPYSNLLVLMFTEFKWGGKVSPAEFIATKADITMSFLSRMKQDKRIKNYIANVRFPAFTPESVQEIKDCLP